MRISRVEFLKFGLSGGEFVTESDSFGASCFPDDSFGFELNCEAITMGAICLDVPSFS
jgi:hypothetical protein